jgi:predicted transcriptional regulator
MNKPTRLAIAIKWYLRTFNITQKQLSERSKVSESVICRFLKGNELSFNDYRKLEAWLLDFHDASESN